MSSAIPHAPVATLTMPVAQRRIARPLPASVADNPAKGRSVVWRHSVPRRQDLNLRFRVGEIGHIRLRSRARAPSRAVACAVSAIRRVGSRPDDNRPDERDRSVWTTARSACPSSRRTRALDHGWHVKSGRPESSRDLLRDAPSRLEANPASALPDGVRMLHRPTCERLTSARADMGVRVPIGLPERFSRALGCASWSMREG
jgi:hypothetical protein